MAKDKGKGQKKGQGLDVQGLICAWFATMFADVVVADRTNGIVYMGKVGKAHHKAVKTPTFENKGGVFYGAILNPKLAKVKGLAHHAKSNVYKHGANITPSTILQVRQALVATFDGYKGGTQGLTKGLPQDKPQGDVQDNVQA